MVDSVEENLQASRRFILLYNASTFSIKRHSGSNNNNIVTKDSIIGDGTESATADGSDAGFIYEEGDIYPDQRQQFEIVAGMHRALLEGSVKVRASVSSQQFSIFIYMDKVAQLV